MISMYIDIQNKIGSYKFLTINSPCLVYGSDDMLVQN